MTLYLIGLGLSDEKDITLRGLEIIKRADTVYLERYTSLLQCDEKTLEGIYGRPIIASDRAMLESRSEEIVIAAKNRDVAVLVVGDPLGATTHVQFLLEAQKRGAAVRIIHNASVLTAVGETGLELYKFGRTTSIVFHRENQAVDAYYDAIKQNKAMGLHTLCLLDLATPLERSIKPSAEEGANARASDRPQCMTIPEAIDEKL